MADLYFRNWNADKKEMEYPIYMYDLNYDIHWNYEELMLASSMHDKNCNTIYEMDYVKWKDWDINLVEFSGNNFYIQWYTMSEMDYSDCEVIGNKYENPNIIVSDVSKNSKY